MIDFIILGFLVMSEMSGYEIKYHMSMSTAYFYEASFGSIYPSLRRLEKKGLIASKKSVTSGRNKIVYTINSKGKKAFMQWLGGPIDISRTRPLQLVKIFFYGMLPKKKAISNIKEYIEGMEKLHESIGNLEEMVKDRADFYQMSELQFGKDYYKMIINWYKRFIKVVEKKKE